MVIFCCNVDDFPLCAYVNFIFCFFFVFFSVGLALLILYFWAVELGGHFMTSIVLISHWKWLSSWQERRRDTLWLLIKSKRRVWSTTSNSWKCSSCLLEHEGAERIDNFSWTGCWSISLSTPGKKIKWNKIKMKPVGWREKTWRECCAKIDQLVARLYTVFCVRLCHESVLLLHPKTVHELCIP